MSLGFWRIPDRRDCVRLFHIQEPSKFWTSVAVAPMTAKVADSWLVVPGGQLHGDPDVDEQAGREHVGVRDARKANTKRKEGRRIVL